MDKYPVDPTVLLAALEAYLPDRQWLLANETVYLDNLRAFPFTGGNDEYDGEVHPNIPQETREYVAWLFKVRDWLPGWRDMSSDQCGKIARTQREKIGYDADLWPNECKTATDYVEACTWFDRVETELAGDGKTASLIQLMADKPIGDWRMDMPVKAPTVEPILIASIPWPKEQPWQKTRRVAASAGYAHVPAEETTVDALARGQHETIMRWIDRGDDPWCTYAHTQPDAHVPPAEPPADPTKRLWS